MKVPSASVLPDVLVLAVALLVSWLRNVGPLWLVCGPVRFVRRMLAHAAQESGYVATASGDGGGSVGMLQWSEATWRRVSGRDLDDRTSPWWSGYFAGDFWGEALLGPFTASSWSDRLSLLGWYPMLLAPVYGFAVMRYGWTHGTNADDARAAWGEALSHTSTEGQSWGAYAFWLLVTGPLSVLLVLAFVVGRIRRGRR